MTSATATATLPSRSRISTPLLASLASEGIEPEKPPYHPGGREEFRICFLADPDGYRVELVDGTFETPQDPES